MTPKRRPDIQAPITLCSRTLVGDQSVAVRVANHQPFILKRKKSGDHLQSWLEELELDILVGFNVDPKRYEVRLHNLAPAHKACPEGQEVKAFKDFGPDEVVTGPFEVHFELKENVAPPSVEDLREWQENWEKLCTDPSQTAPQKNMFTLCHSRSHVANLAIDSLTAAPKGEVETTLRHSLGLTSTTEVLKKQLGKALKLNLEGKDVKFHMNQEDCDDLRDIDELVRGTTVLNLNSIVKLHLPVNPQLGSGVIELGSDMSSEGDDETDEE